MNEYLSGYGFRIQKSVFEDVLFARKYEAIMRKFTTGKMEAT